MSTLLWMYLVFGTLLVALAIPLWLGKVPPNGWYGFRVPSTMRDERLWYKVNRYSAVWMAVAGLATIAAAVGFYRLPGLSVDQYAWYLLAVFVAVFGLGLLLSFRYLRRLQRP